MCLRKVCFVFLRAFTLRGEILVENLMKNETDVYSVMRIAKKINNNGVQQ